MCTLLVLLRPSKSHYTSIATITASSNNRNKPISLQVLWAQFFLTKVSVAQKVDKEGKPVLVVFQPQSQRRDRRILTSDDAKMVLELVKVGGKCTSRSVVS